MNSTSHNALISLGGAAKHANMTALLASLEKTDAAKATTDYLASVGKLTRALDQKKRAMNVTPAAPKPYCRHK